MKDTPNMIYEVIDAISEAYENEPEVELDCMKYLEKLTSASDSYSWVRVIDWFAMHDRCTSCGEPLQIQHLREPHTELGPGVYEDLYEPYCPNCDIGGDKT